MTYTADSLLSWVVAGNLDGVRGALSVGADPNQKDEMGYSVLHHAVSHRKEDIVALLIEYGADVSAPSPNGDDVLSMAARRDDVELLEVITRAKKKMPTSR